MFFFSKMIAWARQANALNRATHCWKQHANVAWTRQALPEQGKRCLNLRQSGGCLNKASGHFGSRWLAIFVQAILVQAIVRLLLLMLQLRMLVAAPPAAAVSIVVFWSTCFCFWSTCFCFWSTCCCFSGSMLTKCSVYSCFFGRHVFFFKNDCLSKAS